MINTFVGYGEVEIPYRRSCSWAGRVYWQPLYICDWALSSYKRKLAVVLDGTIIFVKGYLASYIAEVVGGDEG